MTLRNDFFKHIQITEAKAKSVVFAPLPADKKVFEMLIGGIVGQENLNVSVWTDIFAEVKPRIVNTKSESSNWILTPPSFEFYTTGSHPRADSFSSKEYERLMNGEIVKRPSRDGMTVLTMNKSKAIAELEGFKKIYYSKHPQEGIDALIKTIRDIT